MCTKNRGGSQQKAYWFLSKRVQCMNLYVPYRLNSYEKYLYRRIIIIICNNTDCNPKRYIKANATELVLQEIGHNIFKNSAVVNIISMGNGPNTKLIFC